MTKRWLYVTAFAVACLAGCGGEAEGPDAEPPQVVDLGVGTDRGEQADRSDGDAAEADLGAPDGGPDVIAQSDVPAASVEPDGDVGRVDIEDVIEGASPAGRPMNSGLVALAGLATGEHFTLEGGLLTSASWSSGARFTVVGGLQ